MKKLLFLLPFFLLYPLISMAQGENNRWSFVTSNYSIPRLINFGGIGPQIEYVPPPNFTGYYNSVVCTPSGLTRFIIRLSDYVPWGEVQYNIFTPNWQPITNSDLKCRTTDEGACMPIVIPHPGNSDRYYIFYPYSKGLLYSLLDMSLNNGIGGIVQGQKDIVISPYGTVLPGTMTAVKGCNGVWLVIRSRIANEYHSFAITPNGIDTTTIISNVGQLAPHDYNFNAWGFLRASPDGSKLALSGYRGIELYDFEKCSGKVKNAQMLDTTGNPVYTTFPQEIIGGYYPRFHGICFSPDNSKLYVTWNNVTLMEGVSNGRLYQYDVSLNNISLMTGSKTLILENQPSIVANPSTFLCDLVVPNPLGELKLGPDERIYLDNGSESCNTPNNVPSGFNPGPAFHCITQPNSAGLACNLVLNAFNVGFDPNQPIGGNFGRKSGGASYLPQQIVTASITMDTLVGEIFNKEVCFKDSLVLIANENGKCYRWDNTSQERERTVCKTGKYYVSYFKDCNYTTDTFNVQFVKLPMISETEKSCPGMTIGKLRAQVDSTNTYPLNYTWRSIDGSILRYSHSINGDLLTGLSSGDYYLQISTGTGCDTTIFLNVTDMPKPNVEAAPSDTTIRYGDSLLLRATGADLYVWWPTAWLDTATKANPIARPLEPVTFSVMGINEFGCRDTGYVRVNIDYTMPDMVPNAFSPNGDGLNDIFSVQGITYQKVSRFSVFNRLGQEVFSTQDARHGWDGTFKGKPCDAGVYYYLVQLNYPDPKAKEKILRGDVTLIR